MNKAGIWQEVDVNYFRFHAPGYAVYGTISFRDGKMDDQWYWEARVMLGCRSDDSKPLTGYAPTLENAKKIVETLLYETNTVVDPSKIKKDDLHNMILCYVLSLQENIPAHREKVANLFGEKGLNKLKEMIKYRIILEARNGMLHVNKE